MAAHAQYSFDLYQSLSADDYLMTEQHFDGDVVVACAGACAAISIC